jgi:hypothetical protein
MISVRFQYMIQEGRAKGPRHGPVVPRSLPGVEETSVDYYDSLRIRKRSRALGWLWQIGESGLFTGVSFTAVFFVGAIAAFVVGGKEA